MFFKSRLTKTFSGTGISLGMTRLFRFGRWEIGRMTIRTLRRRLLQTALLEESFLKKQDELLKTEQFRKSNRC